MGLNGAASDGLFHKEAQRCSVATCPLTNLVSELSYVPLVAPITQGAEVLLRCFRKR